MLNYIIEDKGSNIVLLMVNQIQDFVKFLVFKFLVDVVVFDFEGMKVYCIWVNEKENFFELLYFGELKNVIFDNQ